MKFFYCCVVCERWRACAWFFSSSSFMKGDLGVLDSCASTHVKETEKKEAETPMVVVSQTQAPKLAQRWESGGRKPAVRKTGWEVPM